MPGQNSRNVERWKVLWIWAAIILAITAEFLIILPGGIKFFWQIARSPLQGDFPQQILAINVRLKLWLLVSLAGSGLIGAIGAWALLRIVDLWRSDTAEGRVSRVAVIAAKSLFYGVTLYVFLPPPSWQLNQFQGVLRLGPSGAPHYVAIAVVMVALWAVESRISSVPLSPTRADAITNYLFLRAYGQSLFSLASVVLVIGMMGLAMRQRLFRLLNTNVQSAPDALLFEGLVYTLLLASAYIPIYGRFSSVGEQVLDRVLSEVPMEGPTELQTWSKLRADMENLLQLHTYEWKSFGPGLAVMAPFLTGLLSKAIERLSG